MELSVLLLKKIIVMVLMVFMGFSSVKVGHLKSTDSHTVAALIVNWINPCSIFLSFLSGYSDEKLFNLGFALIAAFFLLFSFILISAFIKKFFNISSVEQSSLIYSNCGNFVIPLVLSLLGTEAVFYCSAYIAVQNLFMWTHGCLIISGSTSIDWKKAINKNIIAVFLGSLVFFCKIELPAFLVDTVSTMSGALSPLCMLMLGIILGGVDFYALIKNKRIYLVSFGRLLLFPIIGIFLIQLTHATSFNPNAKDVLLITTIGMSGPVATSITQIAELYGSSSAGKDSGSINVMTTLFSVFTLPFIVYLYQMFC
jgi:predicted permease